MTDILKIVVDALTSANAIKTAKGETGSKLTACNDAVGKAFEGIKGSNVNADEIVKAAVTQVFGEPRKEYLSEYGKIARAGLAGQYTNACNGVDEYMAACKAAEIASGSRQRLLLNLLSDREDHGTSCDLDGVYASVERRHKPAASALRTWMTSGETLVELLAEAGFTLTLGAADVEKIVKEAFPEQFAKTKKTKKVLVRTAAPVSNVVDFVPPAPNAPLPVAPVPVASAPVEVLPASSPAGFDLDNLLRNISHLPSETQGQVLLAALKAKN